MKKSKFLKKSLAMLLALMLVVAMIPLSAAAAFDFTSIYVDGNKVEVGSTFDVNVWTGATSVKVGTNEELSDYGLELRAVKATSTVEETVIEKSGTDLVLKDYASNDAITLKLYDTTGEDKVVGTYTMNLKKVDKRTTTNLASVTPGAGVYSATFDNDKKEVYVVLARDDNQSALASKITVVGADGATAEQPDNANNGTTFTVTSESGTNTSEYTIVVREYADAFTSFSVNGVEGVITDETKDDVPDTITVTLPKDVVYNSYGDLIEDPTFEVEYAVYGNVSVTGGDVQLNGKAVASGDTFTFDNLGTTGTWGSDNNLVVKRLNVANQTYDLKIQLEKSDNTAISYVRMDKTIGTVEGNKISAELPKYIGDASNTETKLESVAVVLYTDTTVKSVVVDGKPATEITSGADYSPAHKAWSVTANLKAPKIVTVTAEDNSTQQYEISATIATNVSDASITAMWLTNGDTKVEGVISGNTITLTVPYMTLNVADWNVYVTPSSGAKVQSGTYDVINGYHVGKDIGLSGTIDVTNGITTSLTAVNKNDENVFKKYNVVVKLASAQSGNTLTDLDFTAQQVTESGTTNDQVVYRAMSDENTFDANVQQATNLSHGVVSMLVPPSLMIDETGTGRPFVNVVTNFETAAGGVAFALTNPNDNTWYVLSDLTAITNDDSTTSLTGTCLSNTGDDVNSLTVYNQIIVLPEEIARKVLTGESGAKNYIKITDAEKYGTIYDVKIEQKTAETEALLKTFKVGDTTLTVNGNKITGELPYSATVETVSGTNGAVFAEFTLSKYAKLLANDRVDYPYFSTGDINGDGTVEDMSAANNGLVFVRDTDNKVKVYICDGASTAELNTLDVRAENRLTNTDKYSKTEYTFELTYAEPCADADITSFKIGNYTGSINGRDITVNVPYGTDVKGLVATFTTSTGAKVELNAYNSGSELVSGVTSVNYTNPVTLYVTSENEMTQVKYTVTVEQGISFSDVNPGDWFYDNVMDAAENGYISGMGDGTFNPTGATTRAQFASMIANAMGYEANPDAKSAFPDVADDFWGKAAINYCVQNGILSGYDDGTFQPNKAITRQEAASILRNAFELTETTSELFPDDSAIAGWAKESVYLVKAAELMKGDADTGNFRPTSTITRAEAASILMNAKYAGVID